MRARVSRLCSLLAVTALGISGLVSGCVRAAPAASAAEVAECDRQRRADARSDARGDLGKRVFLLGLDAGRRAELHDRSMRQLVVVALDDRGCDLALEPLACTRRARYVPRTGFEVGSDSGSFKAADYPALARWRVAGAAEVSRLFAPDRTLVVRWAKVEGERAARRVVDLIPGSPFDMQHPPSPNEDPLAPPLDMSELVGPDCARATHWVRAFRYGSFRVTYDEDELRGRDETLLATACQPPHCSELVELEIVSLGRRGCPRLLVPGPQGCFMPAALPVPLPYWMTQPPPPTGCPLTVVGQQTVEAEQATRLFRGGDWANANQALFHVMSGDTGDDEGNKQLAAYRFAVSLYFSGDLPRSRFMMESIARTPCHLYRDAARAWREAGAQVASP